MIPYRRKAAERPDYEIAHDVYETPEDVDFEGGLAFKRAAVEALKAIPGWQSTEPTADEHYVKWLEVRKGNILDLQKSRDQLKMGKSRLLRAALAESKRQIAYYSKPVKPKVRSKDAISKFRVPDGTKWNAIEIAIKADDEVRIKTPKGNYLAHYSELGMADGRNVKPSKAWDLLKLFAEKGPIGSKTDSGIKSKDISKRVERLSAKLKDVFGIADNPFTNYRYTKRYSPKFLLEDKRDPDAIAAKSDKRVGRRSTPSRDPAAKSDKVVGQRSTPSFDELKDANSCGVDRSLWDPSF